MVPVMFDQLDITYGTRKMNDKCIYYVARPGKDGVELVLVVRNRRGYDPIGNRTLHATEADVYALNEALFGYTAKEVDGIVNSSMFKIVFWKTPRTPEVE